MIFYSDKPIQWRSKKCFRGEIQVVRGYGKLYHLGGLGWISKFLIKTLFLSPPVQKWNIQLTLSISNSKGPAFMV